jgi:restriction system protein
MNNINWWMVRAGRNAVFISNFIEQGMVTIGVDGIGDLSQFPSFQQTLLKIKESFPEWKSGQQSMWASQLFRFAHAIQVGDYVLTYNSDTRVYHVGKVTGKYQYKPNVLADHGHFRSVEWMGTINRDQLSTKSKYSLGAISSLFQIPSNVGQEVNSLLQGTKNIAVEIDQQVEEESIYDSLDSMESKATELIKDQVSKLDWEEMQELVAGVLRAMGYKTRISPKGPDRGKDIIASPDGFGFENPRIVVEVKHRRNTSIGAPDIRGFYGGRHSNDKGLFVSTGGFSKEAYYVAEHAHIPMTLWNLNDLVHAIVDHYDSLDIATQQLIPLRRILWPINL